MDVRLIEAFHAVMTWGTTARAAEVLRISQPAVSKAIMALERTVGFRIFDREKGRLVPTAEGRLFYREVEISFAGIARLRSAAARIRDYGTGEVRLGCLSAFSTNLVPKAIARFRRSHPDVSVTLVVASSSVLRDQVAANHLDLAVTADEIDQTGVDAAPFAEIDAMIAVPPGHPFHPGKKLCRLIWTASPLSRWPPKTPHATRPSSSSLPTGFRLASQWKRPIQVRFVPWFYLVLAAASSTP